MTGYRMNFDEAVSSGRLWRAKEILQGRLADAEYDPKLFEQYGQVLQQMGDLRLAGRFLFLSGKRAPEYDSCIELFKDHECKGVFSNFWGQMPKAAQRSAKAEVPAIVLDELESSGFEKSEIDRVFGVVEKRISDRKKTGDELSSEPTDWLWAFYIVAFLLFIFLVVV